MGCYHPRIRITNYHKQEKAADGHKYYRATIEQPDDIYQRLEQLKQTPYYRTEIIPCKNCIGCRLDYSRDWANRGYLESKLHKQNFFITLTYDDEHMFTNEYVETSEGITYANNGLWNGTLVSKDLQDFIKRLRRHMEYHYQNTDISYMACGEYGEQNLRPHYHLIMFNLNLPAESFYNSRIINNECYWQNKIIEKCWNKGISNISDASWNNIAYTARYITKKINGKGSEDEYAQRGQIKEFLRVSKNPAIGKRYYELYKNKIYKNDEITIKNKNGVIKSKPPKYFDKLYEKEFPEKWKKLKKKRQKEIHNVLWVKDKTFSTGRLEHLGIEERSHEERHKKLIRSLELSAVAPLP